MDLATYLSSTVTTNVKTVVLSKHEADGPDAFTGASAEVTGLDEEGVAQGSPGARSIERVWDTMGH